MSSPPPSIASALPTHLKPSEPHTFNPATDIPCQSGKVILITGATSGIGKQTALDLARHGPAQIWISGRVEKDIVEEVKSVEGKDVDVRFLPLDLADFDTIKDAARVILSEVKKLDILMLNAGIVSLES